MPGLLDPEEYDRRLAARDPWRAWGDRFRRQVARSRTPEEAQADAERSRAAPFGTWDAIEAASLSPTPAGDVASGALAARDLARGEYVAAALNAVGLLPFVPALGGAIRTWHGSPHTFKAEREVATPAGREFITGDVDRLPDVPAGASVIRDYPLGRFRDDRIGTGEGHHAFSRGHYSAESQGVARSYREGLSPAGTLNVGGRDIRTLNAPSEVMRNIDFFGSAAFGSVRTFHEWANFLASNARGAEDFANRLMQNPAWGRAPDSRAQVEEALARAARHREAEAWLRAHQHLPLERGKAGALYQLDVHASPERLIDWDAPLAQQPAPVRDVFAGMGVPDKPHVTGDTAYQHLIGEEVAAGRVPAHKARTLGKEIVGARLRDAGIQGVRYLDRDSRRGGHGTRNYVIYNPELMEILRRLGIAGLLGGGAAAGAGLLGADDGGA